MDLITVERFNKLLETFDANYVPSRPDSCGINGDSPEFISRRRNFITSIYTHLHAEAKLLADALIGDSAQWFRPDWTYTKFLKETKDLTDAERCKAALATRDIPLISWFVNARAGRKPKEGVLYVSDALKQTKINESEVAEIRTAIEKQDPKLFLDAISDTLLTTAGYSGWTDLALTDNFLEMITANFTRIASTRDQAEATLAKWVEFGVPCEIQETEMGTFPVIVTEEVTIQGERYSVGKFLKGANFIDNNPTAELQFINAEQAQVIADQKDKEARAAFNLGNPNAYAPE